MPEIRELFSATNLLDPFGVGGATWLGTEGLRKAFDPRLHSGTLPG
jgi:hypothetical protein